MASEKQYMFHTWISSLLQRHLLTDFWKFWQLDEHFEEIKKYEKLGSHSVSKLSYKFNRVF